MDYNEQLNTHNNLNLASNKKVIFWLILFFPYGLYLMWKRTNWNKKIKIGVSVFFAFLCVVCLVSSPSEDEAIKSNTGINSIDIGYSEDIILDLSNKYGSSKKNYVKISSDNDTFSINDLEFVSNNKNVATIEIDEYNTGNKVSFSVVGHSSGETTIFVQTKDGIIKSDEIKVTCKGEIPETTTETTTEVTTEKLTEESTTKKASTTEKATTKKSSSSGSSNSSSNKNSSNKSSNKQNNNKSTTSKSSSNSSQKGTYVLNTDTKVFHRTNCWHIKKMKDENKKIEKNTSPKELEKRGYRACGTCFK